MNNLKQIKELFNFEKGSLQSSKNKAGKYDFITASSDWKSHDEYSHDTEAIIVAVAASGSLGRVHYVKGKFISSDLCFILTPKDQNKNPVDLDFYFHIFNIIRNDLVKKTATGTSKLSINKGNFGNYKIPYFPIDEQVKNKKKFLSIDYSKNQLLENIINERISIEKLRKSILNDVINRVSNSVLLNDLCNFEKGISPIQKTQTGQYPLVTTGNERKSSDIFQFDTKAVCIPLVSSTGHGSKSLNYIHYQDGKFALGTILVALTAKDPEIINMKFLHHFLFINKDNLIVSLMKGMANVTVPIGELKKIKIPLPSIKDQEKFEVIMRKLDELENNINNNQKNADLLMQSILQETCGN